MRATLATNPALPVVACKWKVRIVLTANVVVVVRGVKNPLRTYAGCQRNASSGIRPTNQLHDHNPLYRLEQCNSD